jgi:transposase
VDEGLKEWAALFFPTRSERIAEMYAEGASLDEIAAHFKDSKRSISRYLIPYRPDAKQLEDFKREHVRKVLSSKPKR